MSKNDNNNFDPGGYQDYKSLKNVNTSDKSININKNYYRSGSKGKATRITKTITIIILVLIAFLLIGGIVYYTFFAGRNHNTEKENISSSPEDINKESSKANFSEENTSSDISFAIEDIEEVENDTVKIMVVGDNLLHMPVVYSGENKDGTYNYDHLFKNILPFIENADIAIINQETLVAGEEIGLSEYPQFNSPKEVADAINKAGFNVVTHANNHAMDKHEPGVRVTIENWDRFENITLLGINRDYEDYKKVNIIEVDGIKIAILSYTFSTNGISLPEDKPWLVDMMDKGKITEDLTYAKENSDFIMVIPHWGDEYVYEPTSYQLDMTRFFADGGADVIFGGHPHVLQPVEWIENQNGEKTLVYYSLGNFISCQGKAPRMLGGMANIEIQMIDGKVEISDANIIPLVTHYEWGRWDKSYTTYLLKDYTNELANIHGVKTHHQESQFSAEWLKQMCSDILGADWYQ